jgi:hypothetical protein
LRFKGGSKLLHSKGFASDNRGNGMTPLLFLILHFLLAQATAAESWSAKPLPDLNSFLEGVRNNLHTDQRLQSNYTYTEHTIVRILNKDGKPKRPPESSVYEVYPTSNPDIQYKRLISKNGKPVKPEELAKRDREDAKKAEEALRKRKSESPEETKRREAREAESKRKEKEEIDDAFRLYKITMVGREQVEGLPAIALAFEPKPGIKPKTSEGKILKKIRGKALFCDDDFELMKLDLELIDSFSVGYGPLVKVGRGTHMVFERRRINNEVWLPAQMHLTAKIRALLLIGVSLEIEDSYSDYKKFSVETNVQYSR